MGFCDSCTFFHRQRACVKSDWHLKMPAILLILQFQKCFSGVSVLQLEGRRVMQPSGKTKLFTQILQSFKIVFIVELVTNWGTHLWRLRQLVRATAVWAVPCLTSLCLQKSPLCRNFEFCVPASTEMCCCPSSEAEHSNAGCSPPVIHTELLMCALIPGSQ